MIDIDSNVKVAHKDENGSWKVIHRGKVVALTTSHAKVFSEKPDSGDTVPEYAQWFPIGSNCSKIEEIAA